jgi:SAM-dependent methyltransferase
MTINNIYLDPRFIETAKIINERITEKSKIIEIGANDASFRNFLKQDLNKNWLTVDKFGSPDIVTDINGKNAHLPFPDNSIDIIICTEVLEHLILGSYIVKEISRVLNANGSAIISVPNIVSLKSRVRVLFGKLPGNAASGDCGVPMDGTGCLVEGDWVGGHVVDFDADRLFRYLDRGDLAIKHHHKLSLPIRFKKKLLFSVNSLIFPKSLSDFVLVEAIKKLPIQ